jgi:hypothetical protein
MENRLENQGRIATRVDAAWVLGITEATLRDWLARGMPARDDGKIDLRLAHRWAAERQADRLAALAGGKGGRAALLRAKRIRRAELLEILDYTVGTLRRRNNTGSPWDAETAQALLRASRDDLVDAMLMHVGNEKEFMGMLHGAVDISVVEARRLYKAGVEWRDGAAHPRDAAKN